MVLPSFIEGWSVATAEAMLLGLPLIVSNVGSAYDMQSISGSVRVVRGRAANIIDINGDQLYGILSQSDEDYENRIALEMLLMVANKEQMKDAVQAAVLRAEQLFSMQTATDTFLAVLRRRNGG